MDFAYRLPGTTEPDITIRRSALGRITVLVGGASLRGGRGSTYAVPLQDGTAGAFRLTGTWSGLRAIASGVETPLEPPIPRWLLALMVLPWVLLPLGGLVGGVVAAVGMAVNSGIVRSAMRTPLRVISMLLVSGLAVGVWLGIAIGLSVAVTPLRSLPAGTCLNGITAGVALTADNTRPVDCATAHDNEVVGTFKVDDPGHFPGDAAIQTILEASCPALFATYVGIGFTDSSLDMIPLVPTDLSWAKGDREVDCVAVARNGTRLTGSVKGTGR